MDDLPRVASYNLADGYLARGIFTVDITGDNATLVNEQYAFGADDSSGSVEHSSRARRVGLSRW